MDNRKLDVRALGSAKRHSRDAGDFSLDLQCTPSQALLHTGWNEDRLTAKSMAEAKSKGTTYLLDSADALIAADEIEIVIDATGNPALGIHHVLQCCKHGKHMVMENVEADALAHRVVCRQHYIPYFHHSL